MDAHKLKMLEILCSPSHPMDDLEKRDVADRWPGSLSSADALELLTWIESPLFPAERGSVDTRWIDILRGEAVRIVGTVGKVTHSKNIRERLEALLEVQDLRVHALVGLRILQDPESVPAMRRFISDDDPDVIYELTSALAEIASAEAIVVLEEMNVRRGSEPSIRGCIAGSLQEALAKKKWRDEGGRSRVLTSEVTYGEDDGRYYCDGSPFTGVAYSLAPDGKLDSESEYRYGLAWGQARSWHRNGTLAYEAQFYRDVIHGTKREWHENGQMQTEVRCEYGITLSEKVWDDQGRLLKDYQLKESDSDYQSLLKYRRIFAEHGPGSG